MYRVFEEIVVAPSPFTAAALGLGEVYNPIIEEFKKRNWGICKDSQWKANDEAIDRKGIIDALYKLQGEYIFIFGMHDEIHGWFGILMLASEYICGTDEEYAFELSKYTDDLLMPDELDMPDDFQFTQLNCNETV